MEYKAVYVRRDGAHCWAVVDYDGAMDLLKGGKRARGVRIEGEDGGVYGIRNRDTGGIAEDNRVKWLWWWCDNGGLPREDLDD